MIVGIGSLEYYWYCFYMMLMILSWGIWIGLMILMLFRHETTIQRFKTWSAPDSAWCNLHSSNQVPCLLNAWNRVPRVSSCIWNPLYDLDCNPHHHVLWYFAASFLDPTSKLLKIKMEGVRSFLFFDWTLSIKQSFDTSSWFAQESRYAIKC